ncbi:hypothetical protein FSS13T_18270 [Flavobacterium saliperosum S13]|uniref:Uncharacterized protein n=2 Tax=Flavobacterium saliperosum TaxID=329186 RepID=A0A1G4VK85_9FLAO|nr:hypothetical protein [Flavobacterium saliperosum]ESU25590.1 hypothetical protein FSS13T_18270 [Flavobacterium saliperosum S13]SCX07992.1 hypothetical protein SAMN02927925_01269 [Flavobacterium saliperosum]
MRNVFLFTAFFLCVTTALAQHHGSKNSKDKRIFISIDEYVSIFKKEPDLSDPKNYFIVHGDTLVGVENLKAKVVPFEYKDANFLETYKKIAFNDNNKSKDGKTRLKYWKNGIKIYLSESVPLSTQKALKRFADEISRDIDSLHISFKKNINEANYVIYLNGDFEYNTSLENSDADYYLNWNGKNQITKGYIKINPVVFFTETLMTEKMKELFIRSLGHFKGTDELNCSSFYSICTEGEKKFSILDREILKYHYSYGICKGVDEETFDGLHENANKLRKNEPNIPHMIKHIE